MSYSILLPITKSRIKPKPMSRVYHEMLFNINVESDETHKLKVSNESFIRKLSSSCIQDNQQVFLSNGNSFSRPKSQTPLQRYEFTLDDFKISQGLQKYRELLFQKVALSDQIVRNYDKLNRTALQGKLK
ncbi:hypothetical protein SS50377_26900 [Spironucleus salmonicida]|uniref:Uncharacterized protein n=1 Tax=Spironucleus salmonicida TaxID=348837 RepID=V6LUN0_9EUKA|nr:hypothetical protein SS50377_26900 [Spironucleus salmonicida]|eukprot:EST47411.1 Hypothetical protein SS50377_12397 [Spironucleus salmonicida]